MRITIKLKLALAFAFLIALVGGMGTLAISNLSGLQGAITNLVQGPANDLNNVRVLDSSFQYAVRYQKNLVISTDHEELIKYQKKEAKFIDDATSSDILIRQESDLAPQTRA